MINVAHDTKMMSGGTLEGRSFTKGADPGEITKNTGDECRGSNSDSDVGGYVWRG